MTQEEKDKREHLLIEAARNLDPAEAIDASDPRYVDCAEVRGEEGILVTKIDALDTLDLEDPNYIDILFVIASEIERQMREKKMPLPKNLMDICQVFKSTELIKKIALFSGGNVREFIRILRYLVEPALPGDLPFTEQDIRFTFRRIIRDYETSPSDKDFELLARVYKNFSISNDSDHFRMLNNHFIFAYVNEETWYDVHPALQEIAKFKAALQRLEEKETKE